MAKAESTTHLFKLQITTDVICEKGGLGSISKYNFHLK